MFHCLSLTGPLDGRCRSPHAGLRHSIWKTHEMLWHVGGIPRYSAVCQSLVPRLNEWMKVLRLLGRVFMHGGDGYIIGWWWCGLMVCWYLINQCLDQLCPRMVPLLMASSVESNQRMSGSEGAKRKVCQVAVVDVDGNDGWWDEWGVNGDHFW